MFCRCSFLLIEKEGLQVSACICSTCSDCSACSRACDNCQNLVDLLHHCFKTNRPAADPENIIDVEGLDEFIIMECIYAALFISSQSASNYYPGRPFPCHNGLYSRARTHVGRRPFVILTIISHCL